MRTSVARDARSPGPWQPGNYRGMPRGKTEDGRQSDTKAES